MLVTDQVAVVAAILGAAMMQSAAADYYCYYVAAAAVPLLNWQLVRQSSSSLVSQDNPSGSN